MYLNNILILFKVISSSGLGVLLCALIRICSTNKKPVETRTMGEKIYIWVETNLKVLEKNPNFFPS